MPQSRRLRRVLARTSRPVCRRSTPPRRWRSFVSAGLENGDLDHTHRQQAFLLSIAHQLQQAGVFGNLDEFRDLVRLPAGDIDALRGLGRNSVPPDGRTGRRRRRVRTLPVVRYATIGARTSISSTPPRSAPRSPRPSTEQASRRPPSRPPLTRSRRSRLSTPATPTDWPAAPRTS